MPVLTWTEKAGMSDGANSSVYLVTLSGSKLCRRSQESLPSHSAFCSCCTSAFFSCVTSFCTILHMPGREVSGECVRWRGVNSSWCTRCQKPLPFTFSFSEVFLYAASNSSRPLCVGNTCADYQITDVFCLSSLSSGLYQYVLWEAGKQALLQRKDSCLCSRHSSS